MENNMNFTLKCGCYSVFFKLDYIFGVIKHQNFFRFWKFYFLKSALTLKAPSGSSAVWGGRVTPVNWGSNLRAAPQRSRCCSGRRRRRPAGVRVTEAAGTSGSLNPFSGLWFCSEVRLGVCWTSGDLKKVDAPRLSR